MNDLCVIIDMSGSMNELGKPAIIGNILTTLAFFEKSDIQWDRLNMKKMKWDCIDKSI